MSVSPIGISQKNPAIEEKKPSKEEFLSLIEMAQKTDHQIYTEKTLTPFLFNTNANLPTIFDLIEAPYHILSTAIAIPKEKLKKISVSLEHAHYKILSQVANFLSAAITPLLYLTTFGVVLIEASTLMPILIGLGFITSCIEIVINAIHLHQQNKFLKTFDLSLLKSFSNATTVFSKESLNKSLSFLITEVKKKDLFKDNDYQKGLIETLSEIKKAVKINPKFSLADAKDQLTLLLKDFEKEFVTTNMELLQKKFFSINEKRKAAIKSQCEKYYNTLSYKDACDHSSALIQDLFREKKIHLANRVQPRLALEIIDSYKNILTNLKSNQENEQKLGMEHGLKLLERAHYNASLKKQVHITNIALFGLVISSYVLSIAFPMTAIIPIIFLVTSLIVYYFNSFRINGILNSKDYNIDWKNCCPTWLALLASSVSSLGCKIHSLFTPKTTPALIPHAIDLTAAIKKDSPSQ